MSSSRRLVAWPALCAAAVVALGSSQRAEAQASCPCDWNHSGIVSTQDIFDFLASYFGGDGDFNCSGITSTQDIFDFLACFFGGCANYRGDANPNQESEQ